ncbi:hypothetical protein IVB27_25370 [Bradyrhizobium sp. 197]|uniref:hypothetical protein n=1 Tax=Bradyrhizobium sp. 197 TaxID=2782663 RepID=UPI001FF9360F|nr:hypothetical protein [Bradyrhizobium sp. 197]MCK1478041.1 hypothetical protein [Bradyrhizobium sp. 197]
MGTLFEDDPVDRKEVARRERQHRANVLAECRALVKDGKDIPPELGEPLLAMAERADFPNKPLDTESKFNRDLIVWFWSDWRQEQIAAGKKRTEVTPKAVAGALQALELLAKSLGPDVLLDEDTVKDRITRNLKRPNPWLE